jgi:SNF2 family DNA or RNA helicase
LIDEATGKVIIFVPFTGVLDALATKLKKRWSVAVVDGGVSAGKRNQIFSDFCEKSDPHLLVAHPQCMSHGLNLHNKCWTTIWYAPIPSHEYFVQANARTVRPGQKNVTHIIQISGSPVERKVYQALQERGKFQDLVLMLAKEK